VDSEPGKRWGTAGNASGQSLLVDAAAAAGFAAGVDAESDDDDDPEDDEVEDESDELDDLSPPESLAGTLDADLEDPPRLSVL